MHKILIFINFLFFNFIFLSSSLNQNNLIQQPSKRPHRNKLSFRNQLNLTEKKEIESIDQKAKRVINITKKISSDFEILIEQISKDISLKSEFLKENSSQSISDSLNRSLKKISEINNF